MIPLAEVETTELDQINKAVRIKENGMSERDPVENRAKKALITKRELIPIPIKVGMETVAVDPTTKAAEALALALAIKHRVARECPVLVCLALGDLRWVATQPVCR